MKRVVLALFARIIVVFTVLALLSGAMLPKGRAEGHIYTAAIKGGALKLRDKPNETGRVVGRYSSGTVVTVLADGEDYCWVLTSLGVQSSRPQQDRVHCALRKVTFQRAGIEEWSAPIHPAHQ